MSVPNTFQTAIIKVAGKNGFVTLCGVTTTGFNQTVANRTQFLRDCENPGLLPEQSVIPTGFSRQLTGSGYYNTDQLSLLNALPGKNVHYQFIMLDTSDPSIASGVVQGTYEGPGVCTALNVGSTDSAEATVSITIASNGSWTFQSIDMTAPPVTLPSALV